MFHIIFHNADPDGTSSGFLLKYAIENNLICTNITDREIKLYPVNYNYEIPFERMKPEDIVFMADISYDIPIMEFLYEKLGDNFIWIDHHESMREYDNGKINGVRKYTKSACVLTYNIINHMKEKDDYVFTKLKEFITILGTYDIYDKHKNEDDWYNVILPINFYVKANIQDLSIDDNIYNTVISHIKDDLYDDFFNNMLADGTAIVNYLYKENKEICASYGKSTLFNGHSIFIVNRPIGGSFVCEHCIKNYDFVMVFAYSIKTNKFSVSCYSEEKDINVLNILSEFGARGHKNACNFKCDTLKIIDGNLVIQ
jgi:hypothetical protein